MDEARIEDNGEGRLPAGEGWFILNLGEMPWETVPGFGVWRDFNWEGSSCSVASAWHVIVGGGDGPRAIQRHTVICRRRSARSLRPFGR